MEFIPSDKNYPVAKLDDVTIHFVHYKTEQEAREKWNRRKERVNYDNLFFVTVDWIRYTKEEVEEIRKAGYKGIVILAPTPNDLDEAYYFPEHGEGNDWLFGKDEKGIRNFEKYWDYVSWLNNPE